MSYNVRACSHPPLLPAIQRCCEARNKAIAAVKESELERLFQIEHNRNRTRKEVEAIVDKGTLWEAGSQAYLNLVPVLASRAEVNDYIACVAHGMIIGAIDPADGPKMLYAAQVAISGFRKEKPDPAQPAA